jgi:hypothetical protein
MAGVVAVRDGRHRGMGAGAAGSTRGHHCSCDHRRWHGPG